MIGTIMPNRLHGCPLKSDKELTFRGDFDWAVDANLETIAVKWKDTAAVTLISSFVGTEPVGEIERWDATQRERVKIPCPQIVFEYNKYMGGVDLSDMLNTLYRVEHKSKRWYLRIVFYVLSTALVNGWLLSRRDKSLRLANFQEETSLLQFAMEAAEGLCKAGKPIPTPPRRRGRPSLDETPTPPTTSTKTKRRVVSFPPSDDPRYDQVDHFPVFQSRMRCRLCKVGYTQWRCRKCKVYLCMNRHKNCFYEFHHK